MKSRRDRKTSVKKIINIHHKIILDFFLKGVYVSFRCRRCSSVVEHVIGNDGVASPILASGTIFKNSAIWADFFFLNKSLSSPIFRILKRVNFNNLSDFLLKHK